MGRGVSFGGGESSLGYLFGGGDAPKPVKATSEAPQNPIPAPAASPPRKPAAAATTQVDVTKQIPAGIPAKPSNNYFRADGQNTGNFITDRPTTKVHAAPGGGSSLNYLFGGPGGSGK